MIIFRTKFFGKTKFEKEDEEDRKSNRRLIGAGLLGVGSIGLHRKLSNDIMLNQESTKEDVQLAKKLINDAKKRGDIKDAVKMSGANNSWFNSEDNKIYLDHPIKADVTAHELGHAHYFNNKDAGKIGKITNKAMLPRDAMLPKIGLPSSFMVGAASGYNSENKKSKGEKEGILSKTAAITFPTAVAVPVLISEALASKKGIQLLKESGASEQLTKEAKKRLAKACGTYGAQYGMNVTSAVAGREVGKKLKRDQIHNDEFNKKRG